jgi:hypothetical protein
MMDLSETNRLPQQIKYAHKSKMKARKDSQGKLEIA